MRDNLILILATLIGGIVTAAPAGAQQRPGWVDPPAKAESPAKTVAPKAEPLKAETGRTEAGKAEASKAEASREPRQAERAEPRGKVVARKLADTPPVARRRVSAGVPQPVAQPAPTGNDPRFADWAGQAQRLTFEYVDSISAPNAVTLAAAPRFYAQRVRRFGRVEGLAAVMADKRSFGQRWPERRYAIRSGTTQTACNAARMSCIVSTTLDYRAQNPARGARSQGVAELVLEISFTADRPLIISESSRVLSRAASASLVDAQAKPGA